MDNTYLNKFDIISLINGLSDHDAQLLTIQFASTQNEDHQMYFKRNIKHYTITDFLLTLSYETWESVFEDNDVNTVFNSFLNIFLRHFYCSFPMVRVNKPSNQNTWITSGIQTSCQHKRALYVNLRNNNNPTSRNFFLRIITKSSQTL